MLKYRNISNFLFKKWPTSGDCNFNNSGVYALIGRPKISAIKQKIHIVDFFGLSNVYYLLCIFIQYISNVF